MVGQAIDRALETLCQMLDTLLHQDQLPYGLAQARPDTELIELLDRRQPGR
jgi:hypothetical protein